jgi:hypothetical protein
MIFPGIAASDRLSRGAERVLLECVVQLLLERGICLQHAGILVFPTLFAQTAAAEKTGLPHPRPLYYDFDGPIDNIYAALVAQLALSSEFGGVRLWSDRAIYEQHDGSIFAIGRKDRGRGRGHLDIYVSSDAAAETRELFVRFVEDHLRGEGVEVLEGLAFECDCGCFRFDEGLLRGRLGAGKDEVQCPACDRRYPLFPASGQPQEVDRRLRALKTQTERRTRQAVVEVKQAMAAGTLDVSPETPIRLLHLSNLHLSGERSVDQLLQPLDADLRGQLRVESLDYLVVSGDFTEKCNPAGFTRAAEFLLEVLRRFKLNASRLILVPGNHDLDRKRGVYDLELDDERAHGVPAERRIQRGDVLLIRKKVEYPKRFDLFRSFYKGLTQEDYPDLHADQGLLMLYPEDGIEFLTLNSAWEIDRFNPGRISINGDALSKALLRTAPQAKLRIVAWHHAVAGNRKVANPEAIERLTNAGYRLCLHGDVHEERNDLLNHLDADRSFHVAGAGSFSSRDSNLPYATPRLYNLFEIDRGLGRVHVRARAQRRFDGAFEAYAIYPGGEDPDVRRSDYWITLNVSSQ